MYCASQKVSEIQELSPNHRTFVVFGSWFVRCAFLILNIESLYNLPKHDNPLVTMAAFLSPQRAHDFPLEIFELQAKPLE